jgi:SAM-dependent methyltransferase
MTPYVIDAAAWQESWDRQQEAYLHDREERFAAVLDAVAAVTAEASPAILDLAGGTGSITLRALRRFPGATTTVLDLDPVLLAIARASVDARAAVVVADLRTPGWVSALPRGDYDAVVTATALHWLPGDRLAALYREVREVLRPGGVFVNADHAPDDGLPGLTERLRDRQRRRFEARCVAGAVLSWDAWWDRVAGDPVLGPLVDERKAVFADRHPAEFVPAVSWHLDALRRAGFTEVGVLWRGGSDAAVAGVR